MKAAAKRYIETNNMLFTDFALWLQWKAQVGELYPDSPDFSRAIYILISRFLGELTEIAEGTYEPPYRSPTGGS